MILQLLLIPLAFITGFVVCGFIRTVPDFLPDVANSRSSHTGTVPRGGGIGFVLPFLIGGGLLFLTGGSSDPGVIAWLAGSLACALLGLADDALGLGAWSRLLIQTMIALAAAWFGLPQQINLFGLVQLTGTAVILLQALWLVTCVNFYNFMDGIDSLAGGQAVFLSIVLGLFLWLDSVMMRSPDDLFRASEIAGRSGTLLLVLGAGVLGFLLWNLPPARIFMGDVGSCFLGFSFGFVALMFPFQEATGPAVGWPREIITVTDFPAACFLLVPFFMDPFLTLIGRVRRGKNPFEAHREHLFQLMYRKNQRAGRITAFVMLMNLLAIGPIAMRFAGFSPWLYVSCAFALAAFIVVVHVRHRKRLTQELAQA